MSKEDKVKVTNLKNLPEFAILEFWNKPYTWHTFWSCLIRCANMKWIRWVLLKIMSGHHSVHRRTDRWRDKRTRWNQYTPLSTSLKQGNNKNQISVTYIYLRVRAIPNQSPRDGSRQGDQFITCLNTWRMRQNVCHFADNIFKLIFLNQNYQVLTIRHNHPLFSAKPLSEPMMALITDTYIYIHHMGSMA